MKTIDEQLQAQLDNLYHNATIRAGKLKTESDYESDLLEEFIRDTVSQTIDDIPYSHPEIAKYGEVYTWGRSGATLAPESLIVQKGGGSFRIITVDELDMSTQEKKKLIKVLKEFNESVQLFCTTISDETLEYIRSEYAEEIEENKNKKRQHYSGVRYI
jgi:hypothetical protein